MITSLKTSKEVGRAKTVLVAHEGRGVISTVTVHAQEHSAAQRLAFRGPVRFGAPVKQHLEETVLAHIDDIVDDLKLPQQSFSLGIVNIGAASTSGIGVSVTGFSIDLAASLAILSCALEMAIRQDIVYTGHIGSREGDILPVDSLAMKCEAALIDEEVSRLVYPSLESDTSFKQLKPREYASATAAIRSCRGRLRLHEVTTTLEVLQKSIDGQAIVLSALRSGFFDRGDDQDEKAHPVAAYLTHDNPKRFWDALQENLLLEAFEAGRDLINAFVEYHRERKRYPSGFGEGLSQLVISLPSHIKRASGFTPLLPKEAFIDLIQFASTGHDQDDISLLHNALYGLAAEPLPLVASTDSQSTSAVEDPVTQHLLDQLDPDHIESTVTRPYDEARARYIINSITVTSNAEFMEAITAFYVHMCRHTERMRGVIDKNHLSAEALSVLKHTFKGDKGYNEALGEAQAGTRGGLRYILDQVTEHLKEKARAQYILKTFKEHIDPLDYDARVKIMEEMLKLLRGHLPDEITSQPPERFADDYEDIVQAYVHSTTGLKTILRRL